MPRRGHFEPKRSTKATGRILLIAAVMLTVMMGSIAAGAAYYNLLSSIPRAEHVANEVSQEQIDAIMNYNPDTPTLGIGMPAATVPSTTPTEPAITDPMDDHIPSSDDVINVLMIGQAAREGEAHRMADTMILVSVNKHTKVMTLTSFLRDTYVKLPNYKDLSGRQHECGMQKLTVCYHLGYTFGGTADAMRMTNQCLLENFGVEVDYNIEVDFEGVIRIVDYFGGLEFDLTKAEAQYLDDDRNYPFQFPITEGPRVLDGAGTLAYARMRKAVGDGESDIKRTGRQRVVLQKLLDKVQCLDLPAMARLVRDFLPWVITDMTNAEITKCMAEIFPILSQLTIETGTCPVESTYEGDLIVIGDYPASILRFDRNKNIKLMRLITEGGAK